MSSGDWAKPARWSCVGAAIAAFILATGVAARAQTIMVRGAPAGAQIEGVVDSTPAGSTKANAAGEATIVIPQSAGKNNVEANVFVDLCADNLRRVLIVERGKAPAAPGEGCERKELQGLYWIRHVSTVVVTLSDPSPRVLLRQGSFSFKPPRVFGPPTRLIVFGGGGWTNVGNIGLIACGDAPSCSKKGSGWGFMAGAEFWISPWLAGEGMYLRPAEATPSGSGDDFKFNSTLRANVFSVTGKVGIPAGRVRMYGKVGGDYHDATFETDQTVNDRTVTVDGVPQTIPGGRQTYAQQTRGWGWIFGGGLDIWVFPAVAINVEAGHGQLKGQAIDNALGSLSDSVNYVMVGLRVHVW